jgi:AcrR family transcriptional regulator
VAYGDQVTTSGTGGEPGPRGGEPGPRGGEGVGPRGGVEPGPRAGRKRFLTRDAVVRAGLRVVEAEGLEAVTVRRVAAELGAAPMALYRHVADKRELLLAMLAERALDIPAPSTEGVPIERLVGSMLALHDYLARHAWLVEVLRQGEIFPPRGVEHLDHMLGLLAELGLPGQRGLAAYLAIWWYIIGHLASLPGATPQRRAGRRALVQEAPLERLPHVRAAFASPVPFDDAATFEAGIRALVAGLLVR